MHDSGLIAQPDRAHRDRLDHALMIFADIDDVADRDLILEQDEEAGDDVLDQRLAAKPDRQTDNAGAGEQRRDVDADMRQDDQRGQDDDHAQHSRPQKRQQCAYAGPARRSPASIALEMPLDRAGGNLPQCERDDQHHARSTSAFPVIRRPRSEVNQAKAAMSQACSTASSGKRHRRCRLPAGQDRNIAVGALLEGRELRLQFRFDGKAASAQAPDKAQREAARRQ